MKKANKFPKFKIENLTRFRFHNNFVANLGKEVVNLCINIYILYFIFFFSIFFFSIGKCVDANEGAHYNYHILRFEYMNERCYRHSVIGVWLFSDWKRSNGKVHNPFSNASNRKLENMHLQTLFVHIICNA